MIPFNKASYIGIEDKYIKDVMESRNLSGDGSYTEKCHKWFKNRLNAKSVLLTTSCTHALEMIAILLNIQDGDEVIMPSYTFVSTANAFALRGAKIVFVDIRPDTMNIDENKIEEAITDKTKVIVPVHYAGVGCEMDTIMEIAEKYDLYVVEDAAQGMMSSYKGKSLGTIGHFGTFSFHETKNYTSGGEGGLLIINDKKFEERAEIIREKGTNRNAFFRGDVDKYSWVDIGSSYLPSELNAAYLYGQLENVEVINRDRLQSWKLYNTGLQTLSKKGLIELPTIPNDCIHNAHIFYIKVRDLEVRTNLIKYLKKNNINTTFHYVPLHNSLKGQKISKFSGIDIFTTKESNRIIRLPMYFGLEDNDINYIIIKILEYFGEEK